MQWRVRFCASSKASSIDIGPAAYEARRGHMQRCIAIVSRTGACAARPETDLMLIPQICHIRRRFASAEQLLGIVSPSQLRAVAVKWPRLADHINH